MRLRGDLCGYEVTVDVNEGREPRFMCQEVFEARTFDTWERLERELKAYSLGLRKNFGNPKAFYYYGARSAPEEVEVTSICENGKEAWIKRAGLREKVRIEQLFPERKALLAAIGKEAELRFAIQALWLIPRWAPEASAVSEAPDAP